MIRRANKLIEELKRCLDSDDVTDSIKVFEIIAQLKDLPLAMEDQATVLKELNAILESRGTLKVNATLTEYKDAILLSYDKPIIRMALEKSLEHVRPNYIERFKDLLVNPIDKQYMLVYKGLKDIVFEFNYDISPEDFYELGEYLDDLLR